MHYNYLIIGGGMTADAAVRGIREVGIGGLTFPPDLSSFLNDYYREKGVEVLAGGMVNGLTTHNNQLALQTESSGEIVADAIVAGIGIEPNTTPPARWGSQIGKQNNFR